MKVVLDMAMSSSDQDLKPSKSTFQKRSKKNNPKKHLWDWDWYIYIHETHKNQKNHVGINIP